MTGGYGKYGKLVNFRLPIEDYEKMMKKARADDRPTTYYLREAVHEYLDKPIAQASIAETLARVQGLLEKITVQEEGENEE